jgi:mRNA interferase MazF
VVQASITADSATVIIVPFTSKQHNLHHPGAALIPASSENGLSVDSVALIHQVRVIDRSRIRGVVGTLSPEDLANIETKLRATLGL